MTSNALPLSNLPNRLLRRKFFDPERVVDFLGHRPSLLALEDERKRRGLGCPAPSAWAKPSLV